MVTQSVKNPPTETPSYLQKEIVIKPSTGWSGIELYELWHYRQLLFYLVWRDVKVRYKQTILGPSWAIISPIANMVLFTLLFGNLAQLDSEGVPYSIFAFAAILPWTFFAGSLSGIVSSLTGNSNFIKKIYFPRLILPLQAVLGRLPDLLLSFLVMIGLMVYFNIFPSLERLLLLPILVLYAGIAALGVGLWLASLNVRYRDIGYISTYIVRFWMYATPVVYSISEITSRFTGDSWYDSLILNVYYLNPMVSVIEGFRWVLLDGGGGFQPQMIISIFVTFALFVTGVLYFRRTEKFFADYV